MDSLQFSYTNRGWADNHGYQGNNPYKLDVVLPDGEYFEYADFGAGSRVDNLYFRPTGVEPLVAIAVAAPMVRSLQFPEKNSVAWRDAPALPSIN